MLKIILALVATLYFSNVARAETVRYDDYKVSVYTETLKPPKLSKSMCGSEEQCFWKFRTRLREGAESEGINYGGKYTLVFWGCGSPCQSGAIIDRSTGSMIWLPTASLGYEFKADSTLLVVNPNPADYWDDDIPEWLEREFYILKDDSFVLISSDKGELNSDSAVLKSVTE